MEKGGRGGRGGQPMWIIFKFYHIRETLPSQTSDFGKKTVSVLAHKFLPPQRANLVYILSIIPLRYSGS